MFGRNRHDRLFARFASRGDVHALGEVFDATAPELMRIAAYVAGSRERAHDLVQEAFLIAIEKRREFAAGRRVLPWLCGILVNLARNARRRERRELSPLPRAGTEDPAAAAEAAEFRAALANAKQALPEAYRAVLDLHLEHGLSAAEIGGALGRPAGTVRTQIVRGLAMLRRQLPHGFVAGFAVVALEGATLRAMRAVVVHRGMEVAPTAGAVVSGAGLSLAVIGAGAVHKKLAVVGGIAVLLALGWWIAASPGERGDSRDVVQPRPELAVASIDGTRGDGSAPVTSRRSVAPAREAAGSVPGAATGSLAVVVRWRSDDAPASAQVIAVVAADSLSELDARSVVSDVDGRAEFAELPPGPVLVQASTGVREEAVVVAGEQTRVMLALDGIAVNGQVVDHRGEPVADADVWVSSDVVYSRARSSDRPHRGQYGQHTLRADAQGRFATRLTAKQCIAAFKAGHGPSLTQYPLVGQGREPRGPIEVVLPLLPAGGTLAVAVHGRAAAPVAGALVLAGHEVPTLTSDEKPFRATTPAQRALTAATGVATLTPLPTGRIPVQVRAAGHGPWQGEADIVAGVTTSIDVDLVEGGIVAGIVRDANGEPLPGALVHHGQSFALASSLAFTDGRGAYRLVDLPVGELTLAAFHEQWGTITTKLAVEAGSTSCWDVRMPPRAAITGRVLDADGMPAGGCYVVAFSRARNRGATTFTDASGRFTLVPLDPGKQYSVLAEVQLPDGGFARPQRDAVLSGADVELRVTVDQVPTARLRGRVLKPDGRPAVGCEVEISTVGESIASRLAVAEDGTFECGPLRACRVRVLVHRANTFGAALGDFGVHEMRDGATTDVGDLVLPSTGGLRVRTAVAAVERGVAELFRDGRHVEQRRLADVAELVWDELPPGQYAVCVTSGGASPLCGFAEVEVHAGRRAEATVAVAPATVRVVELGLRPRAPSEANVQPGATEIGGAVFVLRATDSSGRTLMKVSVLPERAGATRVVLPPTAVELHVACDDGRCGSVAITGADTEPLVVPLARR